jgi:hypothetical protein
MSRTKPVARAIRLLSIIERNASGLRVTDMAEQLRAPPSGYFAPFRPVVSHHSGRLFRSIPATHFGAFRPPRVGVQSMS